MVSCKECGFLAVQDEYNNEPCEATRETRETGMHKSSQGNKTCAALFCWVGSPAFAPAPRRTAEAIADTVRRQVDCTRWTPYMPGRKPKEVEMIEMLVQQREEDLAAAQKQREEDRAHQAKLRAADRKFSVVAAVFSAVVSIFVTILTWWLRSR